MPSLLTVDEVAEILRVTPRTVRRWANEGRIERIKLGALARFTPEAVEALMKPHNENGPAGNRAVRKGERGTARNSV